MQILKSQQWALGRRRHLATGENPTTGQTIEQLKRRTRVLLQEQHAKRKEHS